MARRTVFLLVGRNLPAADTLHERLTATPELLTTAGLVVPPVSPDDLGRAEIEVLRTHKAVGLRRKDVEGAWARVCRKTWKTKRDALIIVPAFAEATPEQSSLAFDSLSGLRAVVLATAPVDSWSRLVKPGRCHVVSAATEDELLTEITGIALAVRVARLERRLEKLRRRREQPAAA